MEDDGLDRIVIGKLFELGHDNFRRNDDAFQVHDTDLVSKAAERRGPLAGVQGEIDQGKDGQHEEEECPSANQDPEQGSRSLLVTHTWWASLAL